MSSDPTKQSIWTAWVQTFSSGGSAWVQILGGCLICYTYLISRRSPIWIVLLVHGITAVLGELVDSFWWAKHAQSPNENWSIILGINEINWILNESATVVYATMKLSVVITNPRIRKIVWANLVLLFIVYAACRINIGRIRVSRNQDWDEEIARAHSYAYIIWGIADLIIIMMILYNAYTQFMRSNVVMSKVIVILLKSSIPRLLFMGVNTLCIVVTGQLVYSVSNNTSENLNNFISMLWLIKAAYSLILLFDMLSTKGLLVEATTPITKSPVLPTSSDFCKEGGASSDMYSINFYPRETHSNNSTIAS